MKTVTSGSMKRNSQKPLSEKTIVITGASSGVGRAMALQFAAAKATLILAARREIALMELADECTAMGARAVAVRTDVTEPADVENLAKVAFMINGAIDVWINNAGVLAAGALAETPVEVHSEVIKTNLIGYLHGAHAILPYFQEQGFGILINNISVGGWLPVPYMVGYSASKAGVKAYSEALRGELLQFPDIHICDLYPAFLDTPGIQHAGNYTGVVLRPAPPVYDPERVAKAAVKLSLRPQPSMTVGSVARLLKISHDLFPGLTGRIMSSLLNSYFRKAAPIANTSGNVFTPVKYGTSVSGGWNSKTLTNGNGKRIATAVFTGIVLGLWLINKK